VASVDTVVGRVAGDNTCLEAAGRTARDSTYLEAVGKTARDNTCLEAAETVDTEVVAIVVVMAVSLHSDKVEAIARVRCLVVG
jgi:hypothetical protein